jgi:hypothetical protein
VNQSILISILAGTLTGGISIANFYNIGPRKLNSLIYSKPDNSIDIVLKYKRKLSGYLEAFIEIKTLNNHFSKDDLELLLDYREGAM